MSAELDKTRAKLDGIDRGLRKLEIASWTLVALMVIPLTLLGIAVANFYGWLS